MNKLLRTVFIVALSGLSWNSLAQLSVSEIADAGLPSIVVIEGSAGTGSGVIIESSGVIATNYHVIEGSTSLSVRLSGGDVYNDVSIVDFDSNRDIAILKIKGFDLPAVSLGNSNDVSVGEDVIVMGAPEGYEQSVTRGIISALRDMDDGYSLFQTDAAISSGSSGGGMFDMTGSLIGITVAYIEDAQNINFIIPINYFRGMLSTEPKFTLTEFLELEGNNTAVTLASSFESLDELVSSFEDEFPLGFEKNEEAEVWYFTGDGYVLVVAETGDIINSYIYSETIQRDYSAEEYRNLMKQSYQANYTKLVIDEEGDLVAFNEMPIRGASVEYFASVIVSLMELHESANELLLTTDTPPAISEQNKTPLVISASTRNYPERSFLNDAFSIRVNPSNWSPIEQENPAGDDSFQYEASSSDTWFLIIAEDTELSYEVMQEIILANAQNADVNANITDSGRRTVNDKKVYWAIMEAEARGIPFIYSYLVYTGPEGTVQIIGWTFEAKYLDNLQLFEEVFASFQVN